MNVLENWVHLAKEKGCSDIHLEPHSPPVFRTRGDLIPIGEAVTVETLLQTAKRLLPDRRWNEFLNQRSADLSENIAGVRCRLHVFHTLRGIGIAVRLLGHSHNTLKSCNLHPDLIRFPKAETGLVLVCGATGSGKSTTLAAMIEEVNLSSASHIVTIESPIEYYFKNRKSFIKQREVGHHTPSFEQAIVDAMREDPDVLVIGEMRTPEVMRLTLNAAETGHLVFSTVHSSTCAEALTRLCMSFPSDIQPAVCHQVADALLGVICQRLLYDPIRQIRIPVCEILVANSGVRSVIRMGHFNKIPSAIQTGADDGMWTFDRYRRWIDEKKDWVFPPKVSTAASPAPIPEVLPPQELTEVLEPSAAKPITSTKQPIGNPFKEERLPADRILIEEPDDDLDALARQILDKKKS